MSIPENPETIVLRNKYYSKGLREIDIWNYYQKYKGIILDQTRGRDLMFAIFIDKNKPIIRRKGEGGKIIQLTNSNYDKIITGRTVTIYSTMKSYEDIAILDIDCDNFNKAKQAAIDVFDSMMSAPFILTCDIRFTGKTAFHIFCKLRRKIKIDSIRLLMKQHIELKSDLLRKYTMKQKRQSGIPNLDISPNKLNGAFTTLGSLGLLGLKCMEVKFSDILKFDPYKAKIK
jgi:hypothetical protein